MSIFFEKVVLAGGKGSVTLNNRIALAPLTRGRSLNDTAGDDWHVKYYRQRSSAGLVITEASAISPNGFGWHQSPSIYTPEHAAGWKKVTDAVHEEGGKIFIQLWHMGRQTHSSLKGLQPVSHETS